MTSIELERNRISFFLSFFADAIGKVVYISKYYKNKLCFGTQNEFTLLNHVLEIGELDIMKSSSKQSAKLHKTRASGYLGW